MDKIISELGRLSSEFADVPMLSRTHGQTASPTTMGKVTLHSGAKLSMPFDVLFDWSQVVWYCGVQEMAVFAYRLKRQRDQVAAVPMLGKMGGAVGNYNAHISAYPNVDWQQVAEQFVMSLGLQVSPGTIISRSTCSTLTVTDFLVYYLILRNNSFTALAVQPLRHPN